jgi:hypothetical protein
LQIRFCSPFSAIHGLKPFFFLANRVMAGIVSPSQSDIAHVSGRMPGSPKVRLFGPLLEVQDRRMAEIDVRQRQWHGGAFHLWLGMPTVLRNETHFLNWHVIAGRCPCKGCLGCLAIRPSFFLPLIWR